MPQSPVRNFLTVAVNVTTTGSTTLIAAKAGCPIVVWKGVFTADAATTFKFQDTNGVAKTGMIDIQANGSQTIPHDGSEYLRTPNGTGLVLNQTGTANIQGILSYSLG